MLPLSSSMCTFLNCSVSLDTTKLFLIGPARAYSESMKAELLVEKEKSVADLAAQIQVILLAILCFDCRGMYEVASTYNEGSDQPNPSSWTWICVWQWVIFFAVQAIGEWHSL